MKLNYLILNTTDAAWNLAAEQYVFDSLPRDRTYFLLWQNRSAVVIGKYQNALTEVNADYLREYDIQLVRRLSGGGAVYHDLGNLNFSIIADADSSGRLDFARFSDPLVRALRSLGVPAERNGRNDLTVEGKKFSGNAQYVRQGRMLHHGTLLFDSDLETVNRVLTPDVEKLKSKGVGSVHSRVTNLKPYLDPSFGLEDFRKLLLQSILRDIPGEPCSFTDHNLREIERIKRERYDSWDWTYGHAPAAAIEKSVRIEGCGTVKAALQTENGVITGLSFHGDFFSAREPDELSGLLVGRKLREETLRPILDSMEIGSYIAGLDADTLIKLLLY